MVLRYQAAILRQTLVVEAQHEPGWYSYGMDNVIRSQAVNGKNAECALPTVITLDEEIYVAGVWYQSAPKDYSKLALPRHTWGFEGVATFTRTLAKLAGADFSLTIDAQVCDDPSCVMVKGLEITMPHQPQELSVPRGEPARTCSLHEDTRLKRVAAMPSDPHQLPSKLAESLGVSGGSVIEALPETMRVAIGVDQFDSVWKRLREWEKVLTVVKMLGSVFEFRAPLRGGTYGRGFFNIDERDLALEGHFRPDNLAAIYLLNKPFRGRDTCQCAFYHRQGNRVLTVYVGRDVVWELGLGARLAFEGLWEHHRSDGDEPSL